MVFEKITDKIISDNLDKALSKLGVHIADKQGNDILNYLGELKKKGVAVSCNFVLNMLKGTSYIGDGQLSQSIQKLPGSLVAGWQSLNVPDNGYRYHNTQELGYRLTAEVPPLEPIIVQYWDYGNLSTTKVLWEMYEAQVDKASNLLMPGYNMHTVQLIDAYRVMTFYNVAVSKPKFESARADASLKLFSVTLTYEDYEDELVNPGEASEYKYGIPGNIII